MINKIYSILMKGAQAEGHYARYVDPAANKFAYDLNRASTLVPQGDRDYMAFCANQLAEICSRSPLKAELAGLDPMNTYGFEINPAETSTSISAPSGYTVQLLEPSLSKEWMLRTYPVVVNNISGTISISTLSISETYSWSGSLSNIIDTGEGVKLRIAGATPSAVLNFNIELVRRPYRDIRAIAASLANSGMKILPAYADKVNDPDINVSLPASILNYCEGLAG